MVISEAKENAVYVTPTSTPLFNVNTVRLGIIDVVTTPLTE